jgi:NAD(P)-dependent dehydrogenase (short-subunit alcohol dehydrogenase family)
VTASFCKATPLRPRRITFAATSVKLQLLILHCSVPLEAIIYAINMADQHPASHDGTALAHYSDPTQIFSVKGLVALITGGGSGIGLMMARALAEGGAHRVYILGRRLDVLTKAADSINAGSKLSSVVPLQCDVTSRESLQEVADAVEKDIGYLNLFVANAGISGPVLKEAGKETTLEQWREEQLKIDPKDYSKTFETNVTSVWYGTMVFLKLLDAGNKKGNVTQTSQVIVTSSIAAFNKWVPGGNAYGQSKAAVTHLARQLSVVLPQWGIRINTLVPGCECYSDDIASFREQL